MEIDDRLSEKNGTGIPDHVIESLARSMLPMLREFYESEEGKKAYEEWKATHGKTEKKHKRDSLSR